MTPNQVYESFFQENGMRDFFDDFLIMQNIHEEDTSREVEEIIVRTKTNINSIAKGIVLLHDLENKKFTTTFNEYIVRAIHESLLLKFNSVKKDAIDFFQLLHYNNDEAAKDPYLLSDYLDDRYGLIKDEVQFLAFGWFWVIDMALLSIIKNDNHLMLFYGKPIRFQIIDPNQAFMISATPPFAESNNLINSKIFFALNFLHLLKYFDLVVKYSIICHFDDEEFAGKIEDYKSGNENILPPYLAEPISLPHIAEIRKVYAEILNTEK